MNVEDIREGIQELLETDATFSSCQKLASLIICEDYITKMNEADAVVEEYQDVLPAYKLYKEKKRSYQMGDISGEPVITAMGEVCKEITEFIQILYNNTSSDKERELIKEMIKKLEKFL